MNALRETLIFDRFRPQLYLDFSRQHIQNKCFGGCYLGSCSIVGKLLCYRRSDPGSIPCGGQTTTDHLISSHYQANSAFHPSQVGKLVTDKTGANSVSSTMRVAPIDHRWWYDRWLSTYNPGSVGHTQVGWSTEPHGSG